ncbi:MAG: hypothetical protein L6416_10860 [Candidatus Omnitrophica bacterium]|nr:hypothetical protein [Candidatus Omnitrophota bacterium]
MIDRSAKVIQFIGLFLVFWVACCGFSNKAVNSQDQKKVRVHKDSNGEWLLLVNSQPYFIKGVGYSSSKVGQSPEDATLDDWMIADENNNGKIDAPQESWVDKNRNNVKDDDEQILGDFSLLKEMGANTIRIYHHASNEASLMNLYDRNSINQYGHPPNKQLLRYLFEKYNIRVIMGDFLGAYTVGSWAKWQKGTDYTDKKQLQNMKNSVRQMILDFKDEPYILLWILGNENNLQAYTRTNAGKYPKEYVKFVNEVAVMIHELDPNHPVAVCNGDEGLLEYFAEFAPDIDVFGANAYRGPKGFNSLWEKVKKSYDKPLLITEYGGGAAVKFKNAKVDEDIQRAYHSGCWKDIYKNRAGGEGAGNSIGGVAFEWLDRWWTSGEPWFQAGPTEKRPSQEWIGICGQGNGSHSPFLRQLREVFYFYKEAWAR